MAAQIGVSFRINKELKEDFEEFCDSVGLSMSAAIILFIKAAVREQRIPFERKASRGKIESITSNIFDSGKVVIPFVNVIDYYKGLSE